MTMDRDHRYNDITEKIIARRDQEEMERYKSEPPEIRLFREKAAEIGKRLHDHSLPDAACQIIIGYLSEDNKGNFDSGMSEADWGGGSSSDPHIAWEVVEAVNDFPQTTLINDYDYTEAIARYDYVLKLIAFIDEARHQKPS